MRPDFYIYLLHLVMHEEIHDKKTFAIIFCGVCVIVVFELVLAENEAKLWDSVFMAFSGTSNCEETWLRHF